MPPVPRATCRPADSAAFRTPTRAHNEPADRPRERASAAEGHFEPAVGRIDPSALEASRVARTQRRFGGRPVPFSDASASRALAARPGRPPRSGLMPDAPRRLRSYL